MTNVSELEKPSTNREERSSQDYPQRPHPKGQGVRPEVMAHYRASLEENRLLAELLAQ